MSPEAIQELITTERVSVGAVIIFVLMTVIQITPIKINPWSWLAKKIGRALNAEMVESVKEVNNEIKEVKNDVSSVVKDLELFKEYVYETDIINYRNLILRFGDEILCDIKHSKEHFEEILRYIDRYEGYCNEHPDFQNTVTVLTIEKIKATYKERLAKKDFL